MTDIDKLDTINFYNPKNDTSIYFLYECDKLIYVGKSRRVFSRLSSHEVFFDEVRILNVPNHLLDKIEKILIIQHSPPDNQDLYRRIMIDITHKENIELQELGLDTSNFIEFDNPERLCFCYRFNKL